MTTAPRRQTRFYREAVPRWQKRPVFFKRRRVTNPRRFNCIHSSDGPLDATNALPPQPVPSLQILEQCGVGSDAVAYRAIRQTERDVVEVRVLKRGNPGRRSLERSPQAIAFGAARRERGHHENPRDSARDFAAADHIREAGRDFADTCSSRIERRRRLPLASHLQGKLPQQWRTPTLSASCTAVFRCNRSGFAMIDRCRSTFRGSTPHGATDPTDMLCRPPEQQSGTPADAAADVFALATVLRTVLCESSDEQAADALAVHLKEALALDPATRPSAQQIAKELSELVATTQNGRTESHAAEGVSSAAAWCTDFSQTSVMLGAKKASADETNCLQVAPCAANSRGEQSQKSSDRIGRYRILEKIGQGGMGAVFRAEDRADGTIVAIKRLNSAMAADRLALHRFQKEARLLAEARHPNIANLLEINEDQGIHYLVMEYVSGTDLKHVLHGGTALDERQAFEIAADVARALIGADERSIVHRDVKPANVMLAGFVNQAQSFTVSNTAQSPQLVPHETTGQTARLRARSSRRSNGIAQTHADRRVSGNALLHVAGTMHRQRRYYAQHRHLRDRRDALRDARGTAAVHGRRSDESRHDALLRASARSQKAEPARQRQRGADRGKMPGETARAAVSRRDALAGGPGTLPSGRGFGNPAASAVSQA